MIENICTVSTIHIKKETGDWLTKSHLFDELSYGWILNTRYELDEIEDLPEELRKVINYALELKCNWLMLDADGERIPKLDSFNWSEIEINDSTNTN